MRRRGFLRLGLFGGGLLALSGTGLSLWPSRTLYRPREPLARLDEATFNVLAAVAARVVDAPDADPIRIAHDVDRTLARGPDEAADDFKRLLRLLENGLAGLLLDRRPRNFTRLDPERQDAALAHFRDSRLVARRSGYHALRKLCSAAYYARESSWAAIGYPGPPTISAPT